MQYVSDESTPPIKQPRRLLVMEPEALLKWSLVEYLGKWFKVLVADSETDANRLMEEYPFTAVVVSEELPDSTVERIESRAMSQNPSVLLIRTVTGASEVPTQNCPAHRIEKPFSLSRMAELLGVREDE